jgi:hypothetical protein
MENAALIANIGPPKCANAARVTVLAFFLAKVELKKIYKIKNKIQN